jgi:hypothetical protein
MKSDMIIVKKVILKNAYKLICLYFFWLSSFYFAKKLTRKINSVKKSQNQIDPKFILTFYKLLLLIRFSVFKRIHDGYRSLCLIYNSFFLERISDVLIIIFSKLASNCRICSVPFIKDYLVQMVKIV